MLNSRDSAGAGMDEPPRAPTRLDFAGWGSATRIDDLGKSSVVLHPIDSGPSHQLGVWKATAICGNDITSCTLYVAALCAMFPT